MQKYKRGGLVPILIMVLLYLGIGLYSIFGAPSETYQDFELKFNIPTKLIGVYFSGNPDEVPLALDIKHPTEPGDWVVDRYEITLNGSQMSNPGNISSLSGTMLTFKSGVSYNKPTKVYGRSDTDPGHRIWRNSAGTTWVTQGENTGPYYFSNSGAEGCVDANGISNCPGKFPSSFPPELENNGDAVTTATRVESADYYYENEQDAINNIKDPNKQIPKSDVELSSIKINASKSTPQTRGVRIMGGGPGQSGYGRIQVAKRLGAQYNEESLDGKSGDYLDITGDATFPISGHTQGRNYFMKVNAAWEATVHKYSGKVRVYYKPATLPDLVAQKLQNKTDLVVGSPVTFELSFVNQYADVKSPVRFIVVEGTEASYSRILYDETLSSGMTVGQTVTRTFYYTFNMPKSVTFTLILDPDKNINEATRVNNTKEYNAEFGKITGDFDIIPNTITYRDPFKLVPRDFKIPEGCTYQYHYYRFSKDSSNDYTSGVKSQTAESNFSYSTYPSTVAVGTVDVALKIVTSCGDSGWIAEKPLYVNPPEDNNPPYMRIGFFDGGDRNGIEPIPFVVVGEEVNLRVIRDPADFPPPRSPSDPDGDPYEFIWHFSDSNSDWIRDIPRDPDDIHRDQYNRIVARTLGYNQRVEATIRDKFGLEYRTSARIDVIPPNPVPVVDCPDEVKENRPVDQNLFSSERSWSPLGRKIDHSKDVWENKLDKYFNGTLNDIIAKVTLREVTDSAGLKSLPEDADSCNIIVHPDYPPVAKLQVPPIGIRNQQVTILNKSYSPDGDVIVKAEYKYVYDSNNNGFADEIAANAWINLPSGDVAKTTFTPAKVGKYLFYVKVTEDYGKWDDTLDEDESTLTLDIINDAPEVSFKVLGENQQPDLTSPVSYPMSTVLNSWALYQTNTTTAIDSTTRYKRWHLQGTSLATSWGDDYESQGITNFKRWDDEDAAVLFSMIDNGYGHNRLNPWRAGTSFNSENSFLLPDTSDPTRPLVKQVKAYISDYYGNEAIPFQTSKSHLYLALNNSVYAIKKASISTKDQFQYDWISSQSGKYYLDIILADDVLYAVRGTESDPSNPTEIAILDPLSGNVQKVIPLSGEYTYYISQAFSNGDKLVLYLDFGGLDDKLVEFDRNGNVTRNLTLTTHPPISDSNPGGLRCEDLDDYDGKNSKFFRGSNNDLYRLEWWDENCGYMYARSLNVSVVKYDLNTFTYKWKTELYYDSPDNGSWYNGDDWEIQEDLPFIITLPGKNQVFALSYSNKHTSSPDGPIAWQYLDMTSGAVVQTNLGTTDDNYTYQEFRPPHYVRVDWNGNMIYPGAPLVGSTTADNYSTLSRITATGKVNAEIRDPSGNYVTYVPMENLPRYMRYLNDDDPVEDQSLVYGQYVGDGIFLYGISFTFYRSPYYMTVGIAKGTPTTNALVKDAFYLGQYVSPNSLGDAEIGVTLNMKNPTIDTDLVGLSFRMTDPRNRYAVETQGTTMYLSKYVNGNRTVLASQSYPFLPNTNYAIKVKTVGSNMKVWVNGIPFFDKNDSTFTSGKFGPFSEKALISFSGLYSKVIQNNLVDWLANYAIWEPSTSRAEVQYLDITFTDPENDPRAGTYQWSYSHTPKFINNQGLSAMHGKTYNAEQIYFDKVGDYIVTLRAKDDPHPDYRYPSMVFDNYRKMSNDFQQRVIVHRRPVAQFTLSQNPSTGIVTWNDTSYDPDRWASPTNYSPPDTTGINYGATRGIMERKYWYTTPSGMYVEGKLTRPQEIGTYEVGLAVRDEYGAWSYPYTQNLTTTRTAPLNNKPVATLTYPTGTQANPTMVYTTRPTITWNQTDPDPGTVFKGYHVKILDETGAVVIETGEASQNTSSTSASWAVPMDLPIGVKLQAMVRVSDGDDWSNWSNIGWFKVNSAPKATLTFPSGTQFAPSMVYDNRRPTITWNQTDPDAGTVFKAYQVQIMNAAGSMVLDSGNVSQNTSATNQSWTVSSNLPTGQPLQVRVRVSDGYLWSSWSNIGWLYINMTPSAVITDPSGTQASPTMVGLRPTITWDQIDPDPGTVFLRYQLQVYNETGTTKIYDSGERSQNTSNTVQSYDIPEDLPQGQKLRVRVRVFDDFVWSPYSADRWIFTNRSPTADFDWTPKPAWEGDTITLINQSSDPDGDSLTYLWSISRSGGAPASYTTKDAEITAALPGTYEVTLTAADPYGAVHSVTKSIAVGALGIDGYVKHTDQWEQNRQDYNAKNPDTPRPYPTFWAGEAFQLEAETTDTGSSATKAVRVQAEMLLDAGDATKDLDAQDAGKTLWTTLLLSEDTSVNFEELADGPYTFRFTVWYSNGVVKEDEVTIQIVGNWDEYYRLHRRF